MKLHSHTPAHLMTVALVTAAALLTISDVYGQSSGAAAVFEGRPSMAGAQGGLGAQAGMAQGGIGVQGADGAQRALTLRKPTGLDTAANMPQGAPVDIVAKSNTDMTLAPEKVARDETSAVKKTRRGVKNTLSNKRHGVVPIDAQARAELKP
ncbi:MAG: hypothetical protein HYX47_05620 [Burkholderiales bacterium]|nr:hypothetical protein [Burkholderiales bacterium]